jgi:RNA recognition motif-containing protein
MSTKLYVGNLSYSTGDEELRRTFAPFGTLVSVAVVTDRMTGQPRGFGFVEYESAEDAQKAIDGVNGQQVDGRSLNVNIARDREPKGRFGGGGGGGGGDFGGGGGGGGFGGGRGGGGGGRGGGSKGARKGGNRW